MTNIKERLGKERLIFDGAMGTMLQGRGLFTKELPEIWNVTNREAVLDVHRAYARAGCNILKSNTFGANGIKLAGTGYTVNQIVLAAMSLAKEAAKETGAYAALDIGPTGKLLAPLGDLDFEAAVDIFAETVKAGVRAGADLILIETMSDTYEIKAAMLAAKENSDLPVFVTFTAGESGRLLTGADILTAVCLVEGLGADALGLNCGLGPEHMENLISELVKYSSIPVIINPNAGIPEIINGKTVFSFGSSKFTEIMSRIAPMVQLIGGCCGTTPDHMAQMVRTCVDIDFTPISPKEYTAVSSYGKTILFGASTVIIGERINPTGKSRMKQALRDNDMDYLYKEGLGQIDKGAEILDVNVGLPDIDEAEVLPQVVAGLQRVTEAPLQIDTANPAAAEKALRLYNGKPLLNSVSGKEESLETILPLVKKYGAAVLALTLDDEGIPETPMGRVKILEKIIARAGKMGIPKKNILADPLTLTAGTGDGNANITLEALEYIRRRMGIHTVLGVSNISFGLPGRERINFVFFTLAMSRGLSAGIINPASLMDTLYAYKAINGADSGCSEYIARFTKGPVDYVKDVPNPDLSLFDAVAKGLREQAAKAAHTLAGQIPYMEVINTHLIPALNKVGEDFEAHRVFLPHLLMSAEAAKAAFEAIKQVLAKEGKTREVRGKVILATVKSDIHDIGKNIVKILLENYNYQIIDLGQNVAPELIAETAVKEGVRLVGLSALMTTTIGAMEETIGLLRKKAPGCKVMVGGAVLTKDYAEKIGADFYSKDAMGGVRYAGEVFSDRYIFEKSRNE